MNRLNLRILLTVAAFLASTQVTFGLDLVQVTVDVDDGQYRVLGRSRIEASPEFVYATLMDFDNFHKLAPGIAATRFLPPEPSGERRAYSRFESCVLLFCKTVEKIEAIDGHPFDSISARAIPELSDFVFNDSNWLIEAVGDATLLTFTAEFEPDFWIPPLIGPWAVRRKLVQTAELIGMRIEWMAERGLTLADVRE